MRRIFFNEQMEAQFRQDGFIYIPSVVSTGDLQKLQADFLIHVPRHDFGFHTTNMFNNEAYRRQVFNFINSIFVPHLSKYLVEYVLVISNYIVKEPGRNNHLDTHKDWSFVDEREFETVNMWCSLTDVDEQNGALRFLKGSQHSNDYYRSPSSYFAYNDDEVKQQGEFISLPMKAGDIVLFNSRVVHGSHINAGTERRIAITITSKPVEATLYHFYKENGLLYKYSIDDDFYFKYKIGEKPAGNYKSYEIIEPAI